MDSSGFIWIPMGARGRGENDLCLEITVLDNAVGADGVRYSIVGHSLERPEKFNNLNHFE